MNKNVIKRSKIVCGVIRFSESVSKEQILKLGHKLKKDPLVKLMYVRRTSKNRFGVQFVYKAPKNYNDANEFAEYVLNKIPSSIGREKVTGIDISGEVYVIK